jgi:hypothetical protein
MSSIAIRTIFQLNFWETWMWYGTLAIPITQEAEAEGL